MKWFILGFLVAKCIKIEVVPDKPKRRGKSMHEEIPESEVPPVFKPTWNDYSL